MKGEVNPEKLGEVSVPDFLKGGKSSKNVGGEGEIIGS